MKYLKDNIGIVINVFGFAIIGFFAGYCGMQYGDSFTFFGHDNFLIRMAVYIIILYLAAYLQILLHEAGHLVSGLISGYRFSSFRIGSIVFIRQEGKMKIRKLTIAGTGGQCLLRPPEYNEGKYPYILYNLGGIIANLLAGIVFLIIACFTENDLMHTFCVLSGVCGIVFAILNGVPMHVGPVDNDGANAKSIGKNKGALFSFWLQLEVNGLLADGKRLKDMLSEWFEMPETETLQNSMGSVIAVLRENRFMDNGDIAEANELIKDLLSKKYIVIPLYRMLLKCDEVCCELLLNAESFKDLNFSREQETLMNRMKKFPSVMRTRYIVALLYDRDEEKAEKIKLKFIKHTKKYPNSGEIEGEWELIKSAEKKFRELNCD